MSTGFTIPKFSGKKSPVIWISKPEAWQNFCNHQDDNLLAMIPCALEESASTWFESLQTPCASLTGFKTLLKEIFQPIALNATNGIQHNNDENTDTNIEHAERTGLGHNIQAAASGLLPLFRGKCWHKLFLHSTYHPDFVIFLVTIKQNKNQPLSPLQESTSGKGCPSDWLKHSQAFRPWWHKSYVDSIGKPAWSTSNIHNIWSRYSLASNQVDWH